MVSENNLTLEQRKALALAKARKRKAEAEGMAATSSTPEMDKYPEIPMTEQAQMAASKLPEFAEGVGRSFVQGAGMAGGDEITAALAALPASALTDMDYQTAYNLALEDERQRLSKFKEQAPITAGAAELVGAGATGAGSIKGAGAIFPNLAAKMTTGGKLAKGAKATGLGAVSGGLYGFGAGEGGAGNRGMEAAKTAGLSAAIGAPLAVAGAAGGGIVSGLANKAQRLTDRVRNLRLQKQAKRMGMTAGELTDLTLKHSAIQTPEMSLNQKAINKIENAIKQDFPDNADEVLNAWKRGDKSLLELYGEKTSDLAMGAAQYTGGKRQAVKYFDDKSANSPEKIKQAISQNISGDTAYYATVDDILSAGRKRAAPLYREVEGQTVNIQNIKSPEFLRALKKAKNDYPSILKDLDLKKIDKITALPVEYIDYAKRAMDDMIGTAKRQGQGNKVRYLTDIKNGLLDSVDAQVPAYAKARQAAGDYLSVTSAMDEGSKFMSLDPELMAKQFKSLSAPEKTAFKSGMAKSMRDFIDKRADGANVYKTLFGNKAQQNRLASVLNPKEYKNLIREAKSQDKLFQLRNKILGGSPTTSKAVAASEIAGIGADVASISQIGVKAIPKEGIKNVIKRMFDGLNDDMAERLSVIIYTENPSDKLKLLSRVRRAKSLTPEEKRLAQRAYFEIDDAIKQYYGATTAGAVAQENVQNKDMK